MTQPLAAAKSLRETVVACLGESLTEGEVSYDWVADLQSRPKTLPSTLLISEWAEITPTMRTNADFNEPLAYQIRPRGYLGAE